VKTVAELDRDFQSTELEPLGRPGPSASRRNRLRHGLRGRLPLWMPEATAGLVRRHLPDVRARSLPPGQAIGVIVLPDGTARLVLVHAWIESAPSGAPHKLRRELLSAQSADAIRRAVSAVSRIYPYPWVADPERDVRFDFAALDGGPVEPGTPIHGGSLALAALVATWSALAGQAPRLAVWTGALGLPPREGRPRTPVLEVGEVPVKRAEAAAAGLPFVRPEPSEEHGTPSSSPAGPNETTVATAWDAIVDAFGKKAAENAAKPPRFDPHLALEFTDLAYLRNGDGSSWNTLAGRFQRLAEAVSQPELRARAKARYGACLTHLGRYEEAVPELEAALAFAREADPRSIDVEVEVVTLTHLAVALRDAYRFEEAEARLREAIDLGTQHRCTVPTINAESTLGQLLVATGDGQRGLELVRRARDFYVGRHSFESPRNHTYTVAALVRVGDWPGALDEYHAGCQHNRAWAEPAQRCNNRAYLDLAILDGRLRRLRRPDAPGPADDSWTRLHADAVAAVRAYGRPVWPGPGLRRVERAARLRAKPEAVSSILAETTADADELRGEWGDVQSAWQVGMVLLEAVLVADDLEVARQRANDGLAYVPDAARDWHRERSDAIRSAPDLSALRRAADALLSAAQY